MTLQAMLVEDHPGKVFVVLGPIVMAHLMDMEKDNLVVRTGPDAYDDALARPHARVFDFTGRPMRGFVYVESEGLAGETALSDWVNTAVNFAGSLPPK